MWRRLKIDGGIYGLHTPRLGMEDIQFHQSAAYIVKRAGRVRFTLPFDQRGGSAAQRQSAVRCNGNQPRQYTTTHRLYAAHYRSTVGTRGMNIVGTRDPAAKTRRRVRTQLVEPEPAWAVGPRRGRIGRDNLQIGRIAERQQEVVRPHARVLAALSRPDTQRIFNEPRAIGEVRRHNDKMVDDCAHLGRSPTSIRSYYLGGSAALSVIISAGPAIKPESKVKRSSGRSATVYTTEKGHGYAKP